MNCPISYYGGKQKMISTLIPLIPEHKKYVEPFFGGGALFFAKNKSQIEIINDTNELMINFYRQMVKNFDALKLEIDATLHSRASHIRAGQIIKGKIESTDLEKAWAIYVSCNQGFGKKMDCGWGYESKSHGRNMPNTWKVKKDYFIFYKNRLDQAQIECGDALYVIKTYDTPETFFYVDPPYYNSDCGHYKGYLESDYRNLIDLLLTIEGKFLLSSYPNPIINDISWTYRDDIEKHRAVNGDKGATKIETIVANYNPNQQSLFT